VFSIMSNRTLALSAVAIGAASFLASDAHAWGGSHSFAAGGVNGGSVSHTGWTEGGYNRFVNGGSTSVTTPDGNIYSHSHVDGGQTRYPHGGYYGGSYYGYNGYSYPTYPVGGCYGSGFGAGLVTGAGITAAAANADARVNAQPQTINYTNPSPGVYHAAPAKY
jgi:hypothetical protein